MENFIFRVATVNDIPFLITTIIESEKSGTDKLSYSTIFGLSEEEVHIYLKDMLLAEIDGCELSLTSFIVAEYNGQTAGAISAWIEGKDGIPSNVVKGNLYNYILPKKCIERGNALKAILHELQIEKIPSSIHLGAVYVAKDFRGNNLARLMNIEIIGRLLKINPNISTVCAHIFSSNTPSIRTVEKMGFKMIQMKESSNEEILNYLPSNKKLVMTKNYS